MARIGSLRTSKTVPVLVGAGAGLAAAGVAAGVGFGLFQPTGVGPGQVTGTLDALTGLQAGWAWTSSLWSDDWQQWRLVLGQYGLTEAVKTRVVTALGVGALTQISFYVALSPFQRQYRLGMRHVRGRILREGGDATRAANQLFAPEVRSKYSGPGLYLAPGVLMDLKRETEGFFVIGAPGSGKTQWFRFLIDQILVRSNHAYEQVKAGVPLQKLGTYPDKIINMDVKGDYTQLWPDDNVMLMAPHDTGKRSVNGVEKWIGVAWDIARDVKGLPACRDFAAAIVQATDEPVWGDAARAIVTGILFGLQRKHHETGTWYGWRDILDVALMEAKPLRDFLLQWYKPAAKFVVVGKSGPTRTTSSYLANIDTGFYPLVEALAAGWGHYPKDRYLSLREWFLDEAPACRSLILQKTMMMEEVSNAWMRAVIGRATKFVGSPEFKEDKRRRIWVLMDEFPQIAQKRDGFIKFAEVGRSKGFCPITGAQVMKQLEETWSAAEMETLEAMSRSKLIFRIEAGAVADYLAEKWLGSSDWERREVSRSFGRETGRNVSLRGERELVVLPSYFSEKLGTTRRGVRFLFLAATDVCRLEVPFATWKEQRDGTLTADWVNDPGFDFTGLGSAASNQDDQADEPPASAGGATMIGNIPLPPRSAISPGGVGVAGGAAGVVAGPYRGSLLDRLRQGRAADGASAGNGGGQARMAESATSGDGEDDEED